MSGTMSRAIRYHDPHALIAALNATETVDAALEGGLLARPMMDVRGQVTPYVAMAPGFLGLRTGNGAA
jgi:hypothetical protein